MRIRTIKPEFFTHEELFDAEHETGLPIRIAFTGLWCAADREGRFKWKPRRLGVQILPYDDVDFSRVLDALATRGFIRRYRVNDEDFGVIPSFLEHQVINNRERESELPEPLEYIDFDACLTREGRVPHAGKAEGKGMEGNREGNGRSTDASETRRTDIPEKFDQFWKAYPRRVGKDKAEKAFAKAMKKTDLPTILDSIAKLSQSHEWRKDNGAFIPHPTTWLNRGGWNDETEIELPEPANLEF